MTGFRSRGRSCAGFLGLVFGGCKAFHLERGKISSGPKGRQKPARKRPGFWVRWPGFPKKGGPPFPGSENFGAGDLLQGPTVVAASEGRGPSGGRWAGK